MGGIDYLVTGAQGQLGRAVMALLQRRGLGAVGVDVQEMPLEQRAAIQAVVAAQRPRCVLHLGAITNVDGCEAEPLLACRVNGLATAWIAEAAAAAGAGLAYVSTDFVFDGRSAGVPYPVDAAPNPLSVYGLSKRLGEEAVLAHGRADFYVVRTSWVFGPGGRNFPRAILDRARSGQPLKVVTDQVGRPTMTLDLAEALVDLAEARAPGGIYHAANEGQCSWHQFAGDILRAAGLGDVVVGTQTAADHAAALVAAGKPPPAARPAWSVLDTGKLAAVRGRPLPDYRDALRRHLELDRAAAAAGDAAAGGPLRGKQYG
ncbi:MAG: dTDP-4-dehydrorhamnose reductase [Planctomycetes bacterium]|nr:dTDP-4-dehydrorhamnose reductase [Planctomycetota bacterium]